MENSQIDWFSLVANHQPVDSQPLLSNGDDCTQAGFINWINTDLFWQRAGAWINHQLSNPPIYGDQNQIFTFYPPSTHRGNTTVFLETKAKAFIHLYFIQVHCAAFVIIILRVIGNFLTSAEGRDLSEQAREKHRKIMHLWQKIPIKILFHWSFKLPSK